MASASGEDSPDSRILRDLYLSHAPGLRRYLRSKMANRDDADEITQEVFARLTKLAGRGGLVVLRNPPGYMYEIALNLLQEHKLQRLLGVAVPLDPEMADPRIVPVETEVIEAELLKKLQEARDRLPPRQRAVMQLWDLEFSYGEIARIVGVSEAVVGQDLMNARQKLERELLSAAGQGKVQP